VTASWSVNSFSSPPLVRTRTGPGPRPGRLPAPVPGALLGAPRGQEKGRPVYDLDEIVNELAGHALVLTGGRKGPARLASEQDGPDAAAGRRGRPTAGLLGLEGVLVVTSAPASSSKATTSVNVRRYRRRSGCGGSWWVLLLNDAPTGHREIAAWTPSG
jgi:hypothetical protein